MSFENKIQKELDRYNRQWEDSIMPNVTKFGKQADLRIKKLAEQLKHLQEFAKMFADCPCCYETEECKDSCEFKERGYKYREDARKALCCR